MHVKFTFKLCYYIYVNNYAAHCLLFLSVIMLTVAVYFLLLQIVLSFHISIDGERGNDSRGCIQGQVSCQSLQYVAMMTNDTLRDNVTIVIIGSPLTLSVSVMFSGINGLNLTGNIKCNQSYSCNYNGSGIVFKNCKNVVLYKFTMENCGLYQIWLSPFNVNIVGIQAMIFAYSHKITLIQATFHNNTGAGLLLFNSYGLIAIISCTFSSNVYFHCKNNCNEVSPRARHPGLYSSNIINGGGLVIYYNVPLRDESIKIIHCQFINNAASNEGGALNAIFFREEINIMMQVSNCTFTDNKVVSKGGAVSIKMLMGNTEIKYKYNFTDCNFIDNKAQIGGGLIITVQLPFFDHLLDSSTDSNVKFHSCTFDGNEAEVSAAVDINIHAFFHILIAFHQCQFKNNILSSSQSETVKSAVMVINAAVKFTGINSFSNNSGTALYLINSKVIFRFFSYTRFFNNTSSSNGGAILVTDDSVIEANDHSILLFINNTAVIGGAICTLQSTACFLYKYNTNITFINNSASSGLGHDIFVSTLHPCLELYPSLEIFLLYLHFASKRQGEKSTGPVEIKIPVTQLAPYPGIPYTLNIIQLDQFKNTITDLQRFPISATLLNNTVVKIDISYSIVNDYTIVFRGECGSNDTLLIQTTENDATLLVNVSLNQCPPGYIFQNGTCHCSHSTSLYYYGVLHCVEDKNAVIARGLWAGYLESIKFEFVTADCDMSLCDYHNSISNAYGEHVLPLDYSLLNDYVCATHRTGVLCGKCITDYTTYLHSPSYQCGESTHCHYGPLFYILSEIIPVTGIFLVILFFNINLTSGALYSFIFYSQIVNDTIYQSTNGILSYLFNAFKIVYGLFDLDILEIDHLSFCLFKNANIMDLMLIKYLTTLYALFLIIVTILVLKFNSFPCIRLCYKCGRRNIRGSVVNGLTAFLILCYFHCLIITLYILVPSYVMGEGGTTLKTVPLYNGDLSYMSGIHLRYVIPAISCLIVIVLPPPIILLSEPLLVKMSGALNIKRNAATYSLHKLRMKLKPFLDSFQGCFKDNCRCFAGLFFLYRILLVLIPVYMPGNTFWSIIAKEIILFLILFFHCLFFPFEKKWHNHLKIFLLVDLLMINMFQLAPFTDYSNTGTIIMAVFQLFLMSLPFIYTVAYIGHYYYMRFTKKKEEVSNDDSLPHRLISYNTFNN